MKNHIFLGAAIATFFAFVLYSANLKRIDTSPINVSGQTTKLVKPSTSSKTSKNSASSSSEPQTPKSTKIQVKVASGSDQKYAKALKTAMGDNESYQVYVVNGGGNKFANVYTSSISHNVGRVVQIYLLATLYEQEKTGKLSSQTAIKITASDKVKGDKLVQTGIMYGVQYLRQAMLKGSKSAANALLRKMGKKNVERIAKKLGAKHTVLTSGYAGKSTAQDLANTMASFYHGKGIGTTQAQQVLTAMATAKNKPSLRKHLKGTVYAMGDSQAACALVRGSKQTYVVSFWTENGNPGSSLGASVNKLFQ
ncbi:serine hydrolase [Lactobacillus corticis]|uniref:Beta-lactamase class A n=1 Tax=Lactobacillus corticis TaxID=2201249 RepID=A0A916QIL5_9LACO|nr:serine hydrolase [Lactobacillus corticis]GFZ26767.1 beta-lactamase class A [Lactobacillus corticis]